MSDIAMWLRWIRVARACGQAATLGIFVWWVWSRRDFFSERARSSFPMGAAGGK